MKSRFLIRFHRDEVFYHPLPRPCHFALTSIKMIIMLINQSKQMLEYASRYPLRLLSLPIEQQYMVQRLKSYRLHNYRSKTNTPSSYPNPQLPPHSQFSSFRGYTEDMNPRPHEKRSILSQNSGNLERTIHSRGQRERKRKGGDLGFMEEHPHRSRLSVLKELMERNGPLKLTRYVRSLPSERIKL